MDRTVGSLEVRFVIQGPAVRIEQLGLAACMRPLQLGERVLETAGGPRDRQTLPLRQLELGPDLD